MHAVTQPQPTPFDSATLVANGKNSKVMICNICKTRLLPVGKGTHVNEPVRTRPVPSSSELSHLNRINILSSSGHAHDG